MNRFYNLVKAGVNEGYTDIHLSGEHPVVCRKNGKILFRKDQYSAEQLDDLALKILTPHELEMLRTRMSVDIARSISHVRIRFNIFFTTRGLSMAIRLLPGRIPSFHDLNLISDLKEYTQLSSGLILVCGATGSGKTSTIAAFLSEINRTSSRHIITLEDPIEYRFNSNKSYIEQRELGTHMKSFEQGLLDVLREDPDVIMVEGLRDPETIRLTLNAVEAGHLVIASLHATNTEDALHRICNSFPPEGQTLVRTQLSSVLSVLLVQKLQYMEKLGFSVPVLSILKGSASVKSIIRDNRFAQIESIVQTGRNEGMITHEKYITEYLEKQNYLIPPTIIFKPSAEMANHTIFESALLQKQGMVPTRKPSKPGSVSQDQALMGYRNESGQYMITGSSSMNDIISQLEQARHK
ncbi:MAG: ATPase, T2SS/T4P/T4SS family [Pseudomonadota bacterium]